MDVLRFLGTPSNCYHSFIEAYFEEDFETAREPCTDFCSYWEGDMATFTGKFYKVKLKSPLTTTIYDSTNKPHYSTIKKAIKDKKNIIFHKKDVPGTKTGPIHALMLQLVARGIIEMAVSDKTKIGTDNISIKHLVLTLPITTNGDGDATLTYTMDEAWEGLNCT